MKRRKISKKIHTGASLLLTGKHGVQRFPHIYHRRLSALSRQRIHVARADGKIHFPLCSAAYPFQIRAEESIRTGDADHDHGRLHRKRSGDPADRSRYLFQMPACNQIRLIHLKIEKTIFIAADSRDFSGVSAAAPRRYDQHDRSGNGQSCPLYAEALGAR